MSHACKEREIESYIIYYSLLQKWLFVFSQLVERKRVRPCSGRSGIQILGRSNRTQYCQRLATAVTFRRKELCSPNAMMQRWAQQARTRFGVVQRV